MLINGKVGVGGPHLLECVSWYLAQILLAALPIIFKWTLSGPHAVHSAGPRQQSHSDTYRVDCWWSSPATRGKWWEPLQYSPKYCPQTPHNISTVRWHWNAERGSARLCVFPRGVSLSFLTAITLHQHDSYTHNYTHQDFCRSFASFYVFGTDPGKSPNKTCGKIATQNEKMGNSADFFFKPLSLS